MPKLLQRRSADLHGHAQDLSQSRHRHIRTLWIVRDQRAADHQLLRRIVQVGQLWEDRARNKNQVSTFKKYPKMVNEVSIGTQTEQKEADIRTEKQTETTFLSLSFWKCNVVNE